jgi:hypothetical protein
MTYDHFHSFVSQELERWKTTRGEVLTQQDACSIAFVLDAANGSAHVEWVDDDGRHLRGTARHVVTDSESANFLRADEDVRGSLLRITEVRGFDVYIPMADVVDKLQRGYLGLTP